MSESPPLKGTYPGTLQVFVYIIHGHTVVKFRDSLPYICSAGVGRTGTYLAINNTLDQIEKEQMVDIPGIISKLRQKRMKMVQNYVSV